MIDTIAGLKGLKVPFSLIWQRMYGSEQHISIIAIATRFVWRVTGAGVRGNATSASKFIFHQACIQINSLAG